MKKFLTFTTLVLASTVLVACSNNKTSSSSSSSSSKSKSIQSSSSAVSSSSSSSSESSSSSVAVAAPSMNITQLAAGDFSSIQGTWQNGYGETVTISGNIVTGTGVDGKTVTLTNGAIASNTVSLRQTGLWDALGTATFLFVPAGTSPIQEQGTLKDRTDTTRDRFICATNGGTSLFYDAPNSFYYRVE